MKGERIRTEQDIPFKFCENILGELRQDGIVRSQRGAEGGYWLARPASEITVADIIRAVEGPLANVRGERPEALDYTEGMEALQQMWIATRAALRSVLERVTLADLAVAASSRRRSAATSTIPTPGNRTERPSSSAVPAAVDPLLEVGDSVADRGVVAVAGHHDRVGRRASRTGGPRSSG